MCAVDDANCDDVDDDVFGEYRIAMTVRMWHFGREFEIFACECRGISRSRFQCVVVVS